ncbi:hypothetical protein ACFSRY_19020 [Pontibacter locisalis]|uniref:EF hand n=1 Tax=Pontibacter locisalis TaxID=1719035 RepID=A0ABW5ISF5_9BACT
MDKIIRKIKIGVCLILLGSMIACNTGKEVVEDGVILDDIEKEEVNVTTTGTWDTNRFNSTFASTNYYEDWDLNDDNLLNEDEFTTSFFQTWDTNNDNALVENEWKTAAKDFGIENEDVLTWDGNFDGVLDEVEFRTGLANNGWYDTWDTNKDNMISEQEYTDGVFMIFDRNDDNVLDDTEYVYYNTYYGV